MESGHDLVGSSRLDLEWANSMAQHPGGLPVRATGGDVGGLDSSWTQGLLQSSILPPLLSLFVWTHEHVEGSAHVRLN